MAIMAEQGAETMGSTPTATAASRIHKSNKDAAQLQADIDRLDESQGQDSRQVNCVSWPKDDQVVDS
eukprot:5935242-Ditylum_brightwellii.AAC.1